MPFHRIDWSQLWYPGRREPFTAEEMARAGADAPSATLLAVVMVNVLSLVLALVVLAPAGQGPRVALALGVVTAIGAVAAQWLWWRPWRRPLMQISLGLVALVFASAIGIRAALPQREEREGLAFALGSLGGLLPLVLWFLVAWRAQHIEARLREQAEREKAIEMARRLSAAQLEPHFLFNTLASLQHWVQTQDPRAAPLLEALTGYLRATLPLFNRPVLAARDELLAVQRYLQVMQARLGERLRFEIAVDPALQAQALPPGLLLTLVENAVVHGIEPQLRGGALRLSGSREGAMACFEVTDNGPGPAAALTEGVGLTNVRERLALTGGPGARLTLGAAPGGGFRARIELPLKDATA